MSVDENKTLALRIAEDIWNEGDLEAIEDVMTKDALYHGPHMPSGCGGRDDWRNAIAMYRGAFPDSHIVFEELLVSGDRIVGRWSATGTHTGELPGLAPTGKKIAISGITIYRFADGRIVEAWEELNLLGMWQQLGVVSAPGH